MKNEQTRTRWESAVSAALVSAFGADGAAPKLLIHGACGLDADQPGTGEMIGIDGIADAVGRKLDVLVAAFPAHWTTIGKPAGPRRNERMLRHLRRLRKDGATVVVLAFHDQLRFSKGTRHTTEEALKLGFSVRHYTSDGAHEVLPL